MRKGITVLSMAAVVAALVACATTSGGTSSTARPRSNPDLITSAEVDSTANLRDAYDLVLRLRPSWISRAQSGSVLAYLDNTRLGGISALRDVPVVSIGSVRFMDGATATATLPGVGSRIISGAIVVYSKVGR